MLKFMEAFTGGLKHYLTSYQHCFSIMFSSEFKYSFSVYKQANDYLICLKGEPELIIKHCKSIVTADGLQKFSKSQKQNLLNLLSNLGKKTERIFAFAQAYSDFEHRFSEDHIFTIKDFHGILFNSMINFQFCGLVSFQNPIRTRVPEAIFKCRKAGVKVIMVTGDHPETSLSVSKMSGIVLNPEHRKIYYGNRLDNIANMKEVFVNDELSLMKDQQIKRLLSSEQDLVFARVSTQNKERLLKCCRVLNLIVAVTGVRTTDLPIFNRSHVTISLGQYGSDITKHNSDVILLDDNFATIVAGIEHGRILFENLKKSLIYILSSKLSEMFPYILFVTLSIPTISSSTVILILDLIGDNLPAISLGYENGESHTMSVKPKCLINNKLVDLK